MDDGGSWALANLILTGVTTLTGLGMLWTFLKKKDEDEEEEKKAEAVKRSAQAQEEEEEKKRKKSKLLGLIPPIASIILFILTEDMRLPMTMFDKWTLLTGIFTLANFGLAFLTRNKKDEEEENKASA